VSEHHVILGGTGFIGRHVGVLLARAGHRVTIAARHRPFYEFPADVAERIVWTTLELGSADWDRVVETATVVHHYAWGSIPASANSNPGGDLISNVHSTISLLEALRRRGGGRVVFASSGGTVYGRVRETPVREDHAVAPITAYGAGKATAEVYLGLYRALFGVDCRVARISNPYGTGQDPANGLGAVTTFLHNALAEKPIEIWGTGEVVRDFIHIADVASCLVALAGASLSEEAFIFNVGSGQGVSLNGVVSALEAHLNKTLNVIRFKKRAFDIPINILAIDRARNVLGWVPRIKLSEGIARVIFDSGRTPYFSSLDSGAD
jgi:UDP-glucose 4-epimerase